MPPRAPTGTDPLVDCAPTGTDPLVDCAPMGTDPLVDSAPTGTDPLVDCAPMGSVPVAAFLTKIELLVVYRRRTVCIEDCSLIFC